MGSVQSMNCCALAFSVELQVDAYLLTCVGATKCLSFYVMKSTFIQCEQFVELTPFIGKEYSKVVVFLACSDYNVCIVELRRSKLEFVV